MNIKASITKWQIISGITVLVLFIMTLVMYLAIGLRYSNNTGTITIAGFGDNTISGSGNSFTITLNVFKNAATAANGKDIYGSAASIIAFVTFLVIGVVASWFISATKIMWRLGLYIFNYLLVLLVFILSIVVLAEYFQSRDGILPGGSLSILSIIFLIIIGLILPLLTMGSLFDKVLFKAMYKIK